MLDAAIEAFFANLAPRFQRRTTMLVQSEFGRRAQANAALGTDHGTAAPMLVIGDNVAAASTPRPRPRTPRRAGQHRRPRSTSGRSTPALLRPWLGADAQQVLGGSFGGLGLFAAGPGHAAG